jgi:hypothetical protein
VSAVLSLWALLFPDRFHRRGDATVTADIFVRRSARLSGVEEKQFSPKPDPDEVYVVKLLWALRPMLIFFQYPGLSLRDWLTQYHERRC